MARHKLFKSDLVLDTSIYADGDVLSDQLTVTHAVRVAGAYHCILRSLVVIDRSDLKIAFDVYFFDASITVTKNTAWAPSDADMAKCLGRVRVATTDYIDDGGVAFAQPTLPQNFVMAPTAGTSLYVVTVTRGGTPTYAADGLRLHIGFEQE